MKPKPLIVAVLSLGLVGLQLQQAGRSFETTNSVPLRGIDRRAAPVGAAVVAGHLNGAALSRAA